MSYTEQFYEAFPYYLSIGMPSHEFWDGDPWLVWGYRKAHGLKNEQRNYEMWLQGLYIHESVSVAIENAFGRKKGQQPVRYMDKPIRITPLTEKEKADKAEMARQKLIAELTAWEKRFNKGKSTEGGEQSGGHN